MAKNPITGRVRSDVPNIAGRPRAAKPVKPEITSDRISPETVAKINAHMRAATGSTAAEWRKPIYLDSIVAGPATVYVTSHQAALIARLQALRSALWPVVDPQTAAAFSQKSARAWSAPATLAQRLHALAAVVHELETHLGEEGETHGPAAIGPALALDDRDRYLPAAAPAARYTWSGVIDAYQAAKTLAFDLAVEAGRVDHQEHAEGPGDVVIPPPTGPATEAAE